MKTELNWTNPNKGSRRKGAEMNWKVIKKKMQTIEKQFALLIGRNGSHVHWQKQKMLTCPQMHYIILILKVESASLLSESDMKVGKFLASLSNRLSYCKPWMNLCPFSVCLRVSTSVISSPFAFGVFD